MIDGRTPLHYAADYGQSEVVRYLLEKGANANVSNNQNLIINYNTWKSKSIQWIINKNFYWIVHLKIQQ